MATTLDVAAVTAAAAPAQGRTILGGRLDLRRIDYSIVAAAILLALYGIVMVYSATKRGQTSLHVPPSYYVVRQGAFLVIALIAMVVVAAIDYRRWKLWAPVLYIALIVMLIGVRLFGRFSYGAVRAFSVAGTQLSPSLFARVGIVLMLAAYLASVKGTPKLRHVLRAVILAAIPMLLVFIQPDLGTTIVLATILVAELVVAGARARHLAALALIAMVAFVGALHLHMIQQYQLDRLTGFLDQTQNTQTANYNLQQSEIAIGSGGISGRGYLHGSQTNLNFVPEQHTDFIFTVVGEEFGFVGAAALLLLFLLILWRSYRIALLSKDPFGTYVAVGIAAAFTVQAFVNIGMTMGIMPITGIPLPFMSYGGSALIADFVGIGLLVNIYARRQG